MAASGGKTRGCPRNEKVAVRNTMAVVWEMALARWTLCNNRQGPADGSCGNEWVWAHKTSVLFPWLVITTVLHLISNLACCHGSVIPLTLVLFGRHPLLGSLAWAGSEQTPAVPSGRRPGTVCSWASLPLCFLRPLCSLFWSPGEQQYCTLLVDFIALTLFFSSF